MPPAASRQPPAIRYPPGSQLSRICTQKHSLNNSILSEFQVSLSAQSTPVGESLDRSNQRGSRTSQVRCSYPKCTLNLVLLFRFSLSLPLFGRFFLFLHPRDHKPTAPFMHCVVCCTRPQSQVRRCSSSPRCQIADDSLPSSPSNLSIFPPAHVFSRVLQLYMTILGNLWSPMRSSAPDHNNLLVRKVVLMLSHSVRWRRLCRRGHVFLAICIMLIGFKATSYLWCVVRSLV